MDNKFILAEIEKWKNEKIITDEQSDILKKRYSGTDSPDTSSLVFPVIGALFLAVGGAVTAAAFWKIIPSQMKLIISFLPLIVSQIAALLCLLTNRRSAAWREGISVFYTIGIFSSLKLIELVYQTPSDYARYILLCGIMLLPVILIFRSVTAGAAYLFAVLDWGYLLSYSNLGTGKSIIYFIIMLILTAIGIAHLYNATKDDDGILRTFARWFSAAAVFTVIIFIAVLTKSNIPVAVLLMFTLFYVIGNKDDKIYSPYIFAGRAGTYITLMYFTAGMFYSDTVKISLPDILLPGIIIGFIIAIFIKSHDYSAVKTGFVIASVLTSLIFTAADFFSKETERYPLWAITVSALCFLAVGIILICEGARHNKLSYINSGIISVFTVIISSLSKETGNFTKGIFFIILGIIFIVTNIILSKRYKTKKNKYGEMQVINNEKQ